MRLLVVEVENEKEASRFIYYIEETDLPQKCRRINNLDVDILICGAVSQSFFNMLRASGLDVIQQISGLAEEVLEAFLNGNIYHSKFLMPGCKRHRNRYGKDIKDHIQHKKANKPGRNRLCQKKIRAVD